MEDNKRVIEISGDYFKCTECDKIKLISRHAGQSICSDCAEWLTSPYRRN